VRTPLDRIFKNTAEIEPRGLLHLFGSLRIDEPAEVKELDREVGLEAVHLDHLYEVRTATWHGLHHFEFQTRYQMSLPQRIVNYNLVTYLRYKLPVQSTLVLPVEKYAPAGIPDSAQIEAGGLRIDCQYRVIRMWELDPAEIFALNRPALLACIPLVSSNRGDWSRAAKEIVATGNKALAGAFLSLGGVRYDRTELEGVLEQVTLEEFIPRDWIRHSSVVEPLIEQAEKDGADRGRIAEARRMLAMAVTTRFPELTLPPGIQAISDPTAIEDAFRAVLGASSPAEAEAALLRATTPSR